MKIRIVLFCGIIAIFSLACKQTADAAETYSEPDDGELLIGLTVFDTYNPYFYELIKGAEEQALISDIELMINDPQSSIEKQIEAIDGFIEAGADVIIVAALSPEDTEPILQKASEKGIKIIAQSMKTRIYDIYVSADEWEMGYKSGTAAVEWMEKRDKDDVHIALLHGATQQIRMREKGVLDALSIKGYDKRVVHKAYFDNTRKVQSSVSDMLDQNPDINVILCSNDAIALQAWGIVSNRGYTKENFYIGGIDAIPRAVEKIKEDGVFTTTVDLYPYENGKLLVQISKMLHDGENLPLYHRINANTVKRESFLE